MSVVMDRQGNLFYSDLERVWRIAPNGARSVAVPAVHTHELYVDARDNLYGEHLWYEGDATRRWRHRVWRRSPGGRVIDVITSREGFRTNYSFVRDAAGNMYSVDRERVPVSFRKRRPDGTVTTAALCRDCRDVQWMTATPEGVLYFVDGRDLRELLPRGTIRTVAPGIGRRIASQLQVPAHHTVMGLWTDPERNVYAAVYGSRETLRISRDGRTRVVATSPFPWAPTGGMVGRDGELWLLEWSSANRARVRKVAGFAAAACRDRLDRATSRVETAVRAFEAATTVESARHAIRLASEARDELETATPAPRCIRAHHEELIYLNHLIPGFQAWIAARTGVPPRPYEIASILRRARTHRERGRGDLAAGNPSPPRGVFSGRGGSR